MSGLLPPGAAFLLCFIHALEIDTVLEGTVGIALVGVGIWSLRTARNLHRQDPSEHRAPAAVERMARWAGSGSIAVGLWWIGRVLLAG